MSFKLGIMAVLSAASSIISNWISRTSPLANGNSTNSVVYAPLTNASWYIFGNAGSNLTTYLYSTDTSSWTQGTLPTAGRWGASASNGTRILVFQTGTSSNTALTSTNGTTWTSVTITGNPTVTNAYYDGTRFIVTNGGGSSISWSLDGTTGWTTQAVGGASSWVGYDGTSRHIITRTTTSTTALTSTTGITGTWSTVTLPSSNTWLQVFYANGYWLAAVQTGGMAYSTNGTTWTLVGTATGNLYTWIYANSKWYSFTSGASTSARYRDTPAATSTSITLGSASGDPNAVAFADNRLVVATSGTDIWVGV